MTEELLPSPIVLCLCCVFFSELLAGKETRTISQMICLTSLCDSLGVHLPKRESKRTDRTCTAVIFINVLNYNSLIHIVSFYKVQYALKR